MTDAHFQALVLNERLRLWFPEHVPRAQDPQYRLFNAAKRKAKALDVPCWRCGVRRKDLNPHPLGPTTAQNPLGGCQLELHHDEIEFSLSNAVDVEHWWQASTEDVNNAFKHVYSDLAGFLERHPELDPKNHKDVFDAYVESEGNLQVLCDRCQQIQRSRGASHPDAGMASVGSMEAGSIASSAGPSHGPLLPQKARLALWAGRVFVVSGVADLVFELRHLGDLLSHASKRRNRRLEIASGSLLETATHLPEDALVLIQLRLLGAVGARTQLRQACPERVDISNRLTIDRR